MGWFLEMISVTVTSFKVLEHEEIFTLSPLTSTTVSPSVGNGRGERKGGGRGEGRK